MIPGAGRRKFQRGRLSILRNKGLEGLHPSGAVLKSEA